MNQGEIIIYQSEEKPNIQLEVRIEDETVWLTQAQMVELFDSSKQNISLHINNIYKERELEKHVTVKEYLTVQKEGIFFDGQIFDAWQFATNIIKSAKSSIILIDNYIDESVLTLLSKREQDVKATIYTTRVTKQLQLDLEKFNTQYKPIQIKIFKKSHDRFIIIDNNEIFHIGASLKDLGKRWFAFSKMTLNAKEILSKLS